jgi:hypothetical protein
LNSCTIGGFSRRAQLNERARVLNNEYLRDSYRSSSITMTVKSRWPRSVGSGRLSWVHESNERHNECIINVADGKSRESSSWRTEKENEG